MCRIFLPALFCFVLFAKLVRFPPSLTAYIKEKDGNERLNANIAEGGEGRFEQDQGGMKKGRWRSFKMCRKVFRSEGEAITEERELLVESVKDEQGEKNAQFFRAE